MHIQDIFDQHATTFSFEFFPPRSAEAADQLYQSIKRLETLKPSFVSVTYGAGGSTRLLTHDLVIRIQQQTSLHPVPHLTCVGHDRAEIAQILERYATARIGSILALAGDPPRGSDAPRTGDFPHAIDLVRFVRRFGDGEGHDDRRGFGIGVAGFPEGHPATPNRLV